MDCSSFLTQQDVTIRVFWFFVKSGASGTQTLRVIDFRVDSFCNDGYRFGTCRSFTLQKAR